MEVQEYKKSPWPWLVLIGCCIMSAIGFSVPATLFSVFIVPLQAALDTSIASLQLYYTILTVASMVVFLAANKVTDVIGFGRSVAIFGALGGLAFIALSQFASLPMIYVAAAIMGFAYPITSLFSIPVIVTRWFKKATGTFISIALAFAGVGAAIMSPIITGVITSSGWQQGMFDLGVLYIVAMVAVGLLLIKDSPEKMGVLPFGVKAEDLQTTGEASAEAVSQAEGIERARAFKAPAFWLVVATIFVLGWLGSINTNVNVMVQTSGYSPNVAAFALSLSAIANIVGKPCMGILKDRFNAVAAEVFVAVFVVAGMCLYIFAALNFNETLIYVAAFITGLGACGSITMPPLVTSDAVGLKEYGKIYGVLSSVRALGGAVSSPIIGMVYDRSGSYVTNMGIFIVMAIIAVPLAAFGIRGVRKKWKA